MKSRKMALCGLLTALAVVLMVLSGAIGIGTYAGPVLAMAVLLPILEEYGAKAAATAYAASAILALLLVPQLELSLVYSAFGWYPLLRPHLARLPSPVLRTAIRMALCTGILLVLYGVLLRFLGLTADILAATPLFNALLLAMGNAVFLLTDRALARLTVVWHRRLRARLIP